MAEYVGYVLPQLLCDMHCLRGGGAGHVLGIQDGGTANEPDAGAAGAGAGGGYKGDRGEVPVSSIGALGSMVVDLLLVLGVDSCHRRIHTIVLALCSSRSVYDKLAANIVLSHLDTVMASMMFPATAFLTARVVFESPPRVIKPTEGFSSAFSLFNHVCFCALSYTA